MVGYPVENTLTEHGHVSRGICAVTAGRELVGITERTRIQSFNGEVRYTEDGSVWHHVPNGTPVSMNLWGFTPGLMAELERRFPLFLLAMADPLKNEFYLPVVVDALVREGKASVKVLPTDDRWFGVTYQQDKSAVSGAIAALVDRGRYPGQLWSKG
jgi:hypothetical protein